MAEQKPLAPERARETPVPRVHTDRGPPGEAQLSDFDRATADSLSRRDEARATSLRRARQGQ
jgi:hypothetical protein